MKRFVVAYDKFKDCLKASQLCDLTRKALERVLEYDKIKVSTIPLADGGDGFLDCIEEAFISSSKVKSSRQLFSQYNMRKINLTATGPLGDPANVHLLLEIDFLSTDETKE